MPIMASVLDFTMKPADPREQDVCPRYEALTDDQMALLDACDVLERLAERLGSYRRVQSVLRTVASINGEGLD